MDLSKFKRVDFDDDNAMPDWLRDDTSAIDEKKPFLPTRRAKLTQSQMKPTEGFSQSQVKPILSPRTLRTEEKKRREHPQPTVSIQIHMPQLRLPKISVPWRKLRPLFVVLGIVLVLLLGGKWMQTKLATAKPTEKKAPVVVAADLGYKPILPQARTDTAQSAAIPKPSFDEQRHLYTFNDIYKGANLTVNQQAIPEKLKGSETGVKKLATSIGATESFTTTRGKVYIATSKESGTQRLMIANNKMLMFIQSTKAVSNSDWVSYIQSLN